jgi:hypothetical protein
LAGRLPVKDSARRQGDAHTRDFVTIEPFFEPGEERPLNPYHRDADGPGIRHEPWCPRTVEWVSADDTFCACRIERFRAEHPAASILRVSSVRLRSDWSPYASARASLDHVSESAQKGFAVTVDPATAIPDMITDLLYSADEYELSLPDAMRELPSILGGAAGELFKEAAELCGASNPLALGIGVLGGGIVGVAVTPLVVPLVVTTEVLACCCQAAMRHPSPPTSQRRR